MTAKIRVVQELQAAKVYLEGPNGELIKGPHRFEDIFDFSEGQKVGFRVKTSLDNILPLIGLEPFGDGQQVELSFEMPAVRVVRETTATDPADNPDAKPAQDG